MGCWASKNTVHADPRPGAGTAVPGAVPPLRRGDSHPVPKGTAKSEVLVEHDYSYDVFMSHDWGASPCFVPCLPQTCMLAPGLVEGGREDARVRASRAAECSLLLQLCEAAAADRRAPGPRAA